MDTSERAAMAVQEAVERRIRAEYRNAQRELTDKLHGFIEAHKAREAKYRAMVAAGKMSQEDFDAWMQGQIFQSKQWMRMRDSVARTLYQADVSAQKIVNGERGNIFAQSANHTLYDLEHEKGVTFGFELYDQSAVAKILREQPRLLPPKEVSEAKDIAWYQHKINSVVVQGIIQGEGIGQIASRVGRETGELSRNSMLRNARTSMTSAHSAGKLDAMHAMKERGIDVKKRWVATLDLKTRPAHASLDGVEVDIDEPFTTPMGDIERPGDPNAPACLVYNCRCMLFSVFGKYPASYTRRDMNGKLVKDMTYREWERKMQGQVPFGSEDITRIDSRIKQLQDELDNWDDTKYANIAVSGNEFLKIQDEVEELYVQRAALEYSDDDVMKGIRHIDRKHTVTQDILRVNLNYGKSPEWNRNCQRCVPTYEMRRRGYDVKALPRIIDREDNLAHEWRNIFEKAQWEKCDNGSGYQGVIRRMKDWGDGARAEVYVKWKDQPWAHVFVAENIDGKVVFRDPQSGFTDMPPWQARVEEGKTEICRVDNLKPSKLILDCMEEV